jgi:glycosyltransferase involved in cell wall biosynthesis
MIAESLPVPFDRRVWSKATTLRAAGFEVSVICPKGKRADRSHEVIGGIHIYRHPQAFEAKGALGYPLEYAWALFFEFCLAWRVLLTRGFDIIHACNPPDTICLIGGFFKLLLGKQFVFDHRHLNPEIYEAKFGRRDFVYRLLLRLEGWTFRTADISLAPNRSYEDIAIKRGGMRRERVFLVRPGPRLERMKIMPPSSELKSGRTFLVGYVGVIGPQSGIDILLRSVAHIAHALERCDVHFGIVGGGPALEEMKQLAVRLGVERYVTFTGRAGEDDGLAMLNTADVCVSPDRAIDMNDKSTMSKIMEYMALKKPIVQFNLTEGRFTARDGSLYAEKNDPVDFAERILELLADPVRRARLGAYGYMRLRDELSWGHQAPKLVAAYAALERLRFKLPLPEPKLFTVPRARSRLAQPVRAAE